MTLGKASEVVRRDILNTAVIHDSISDVPFLDQVAKPFDTVRVNFIIVSSHKGILPILRHAAA